MGIIWEGAEFILVDTLPANFGKGDRPFFDRHFCWGPFSLGEGERLIELGSVPAVYSRPVFCEKWGRGRGSRVISCIAPTIMH